LDFAHRPIFRRHNVSETGYISVFRRLRSGFAKKDKKKIYDRYFGRHMKIKTNTKSKHIDIKLLQNLIQAFA
jgi:hypothetical protein